MSEIVDAEIVEEPQNESVDEGEGIKEESGQPQRLSIDSIGGLKIRKPQESLPHLNFMVYGDSGAGKTMLAGTSAYVKELSPVLFIDVEGGTLTLSQFDQTADIDVVRADKWETMQKVYDELYRGRHPYKTVVIDSLTEMQKLAMSSQLGAGSQLDPGGNTAEFKDWYINTEQMRRLVRAFRDLSMNTIFTALAQATPHPRKPNIELVKPDFTKKLANEIPAFFDILFYMYVKTVPQGPNVRLLQTDKTDTVVAKCRVAGVPENLQNPNMDILYDLLIRNPGTTPTPLRTDAGESASTASAGKGKMTRRK